MSDQEAGPPTDSIDDELAQALDIVRELVDLEILSATNLAAACDYSTEVLRIIRDRFESEAADARRQIDTFMQSRERLLDEISERAQSITDEVAQRAKEVENERRAAYDKLTSRVGSSREIHASAEGGYWIEKKSKYLHAARSDKLTLKHARELEALQQLDQQLTECRRTITRNSTRTKALRAELDTKYNDLLTRAEILERRTETADAARVLAIQRRLDER